MFFSSLGKQREKTSLYDFTLRPLKTREYNTFSDYVNLHSFSAHSIVLYLCYHADELPIPSQTVNPLNPVPVQASEDGSIPIEDASVEAMETEPVDLRT
jgi:hypothetical protein